MTPLHTAVKVKRSDIAGYLVQEGGKIEDEAPFGNSKSKKNAIELMYLHHKDLEFLEELEPHIRNQQVCIQEQPSGAVGLNWEFWWAPVLRSRSAESYNYRDIFKICSLQVSGAHNYTN